MLRSPTHNVRGGSSLYRGGYSGTYRTETDSQGRQIKSRVIEKNDGRVITIKSYGDGEEKVTVRDRAGNSETVHRDRFGVREWSVKNDNGESRDNLRRHGGEGARTLLGNVVDAYG